MPRTPASPSTCTGPGLAPGSACGRPIRALTLCASHYQQHRREQPLSPLIRQGERLAAVSIRVPEPVRDAVQADPPGARDALERWARR